MFIKKLFKNKILLVLLVVGVGLAGYFIYGAIKGGGATQTRYLTAKAQKGTLVVSVSGSGQVAASSQTNIQAQGSGLVVAIPVANNQKVSAGDLLVKLDTTNDDRAVRNAGVNLQSAELQLQTLLSPPATSTLLQAEQSAVQAKQNLETAKSNLASDYNGAYTAISNTFIDIPGVMTGLNNVLYSTALNKVQNDIDAYTNLVSNYTSAVYQYNQNAAAGYQVALTSYNQVLADYKNSSIYSSTSTIESLLGETYGMLKTISAANGDAKNLLDLVNTTLQQNNQKIPAQLAADETGMQSYLTSANNHLATILQIQNSLQTDKQEIDTATLSVAQTEASLEQLRNGPTDLQIQAQKLSLTQAQNSLADAKANLSNDYVLAPFAGIVTNIAAKIGQPAAGTLAVLVGSQQLAQATFNEVDIVNVRVGEKATVTFDALPGLALTGKVAEVDTLGTISQGVVSYNVQVALGDNNPSVRPGMSDTVEIITNVGQDVLLVPSSAVTTRQNASYVQVMGADGIPRETQVTIGLANDNQTEIASGLNDGDEVVTQKIPGSSATQGPAQTRATGGGAFRAFGL